MVKSFFPTVLLTLAVTNVVAEDGKPIRLTNSTAVIIPTVFFHLAEIEKLASAVISTVDGPKSWDETKSSGGMPC